MKNWTKMRDLLTKKFRIGKWAEYAYDAPSGALQFKDASGKAKVQAGTVPHGSFSGKSNTWQRSWANKSTPPRTRKQAEKVKELFKLTGMEVFKMATIEIDEAVACELVAMCVSHLDARGSYAMPAGDDGKLTVFMAIQEIGNVSN
jgi:hypothetical protein